MEVFEFEDMEQRMIDFFKQDIKLYSVGFDQIDPFYQFIPSGVTDITGYPYSGKTLVLNELLYNLTEKNGMKNLLHLPDSGKPEEVVAHLIHKDSGKTFDKRYPNVIQEKDISQAVYSIISRFKILKTLKDKNGRMQRPTPYDFWEFAIKEGYHTASIDSWNYMKHEGTGTDYLRDVLSYRNELADLNPIHLFTIIHPPKPTEKNFNAQGKLKPPDIYDLMGGSEWANNARNVISVHKEEKEGIEYDWYFQKIKPRMVGKTGMTTLNFDIPLQKFYTAEYGKRVYAFGESEEIEVIKPDGGMKNWTEEEEKSLLDSSNFEHSNEEIKGKLKS